MNWQQEKGEKNPVNEIVELLEEGESEKVEFKPSLSQMDKIMESISALSNTNGGTVVIGVRDKGEVLGVDIGKRTIEKQSEVKCIRFKGVGVTGEMIDLRTVDGDVFDQLIEAEKFIFNNIALSAWIEEGKMQRQERWEYPPKAIREALANKKILIQRGTSKKLTYYELSV